MVDIPMAHIDPSAEIQNRLSHIEGDWRELSRTPRPHFSTHLQSCQVTHIEGLARLHKSSQTPSSDLAIVRRQMEQFISGHYGTLLPLVYIVQGIGRKIQVWLGTTGAGYEGLCGNLQALFPGMVFSRNAYSFPEEIDHCPACMILLGNPSPPRLANNTLSSLALDTLIRGMVRYPQDWAYLVVAYPASVDHIREYYERISKENLGVALEFFREGNPDRHNKIVERYLQSLQMQMEKLQRAKEVGGWGVQVYYLGTPPQCTQMTALLQATLAGKQSRPEPLSTHWCSADRQRGPSRVEYMTFLNSAELSLLAQIPQEEHPGYSVQRHIRFDVVPPFVKDGEETMLIGYIQDLGGPTGGRLRIRLDDMVKHTLVSGTTGSGKSTTCFHLLHQLWTTYRIPFLVIEPVKGEYFRLKGAMQELKRYTLGNESLFPMRINPLEVAGVSVQTHIDGLMSLFAATFVLYPPMPYVLEQSLHEVYEDKGWNLTTGTCWRGGGHHRAFPTLTDLYFKIEQVVDRLGYEARIAMDVQAALQTRVNNLRIGVKGSMLDTRESFDMKRLLEFPTVLEMKDIGNDEQKAFLMGLVLLRLYEYYSHQRPPVEEHLGHVTLIEEAHRLLQHTSAGGGEDFADPRAKAIETFANILSEIRAYGEGVIVVEQIPTKLVADVLKNTTTKLAHRMVAAEDRAVLGATMGLEESETMAMLTLNRGEFLAFSERMDRPVRVRIAPPQISPGVGQKQLLQSERGRELPSVSSASRASWTAIARILAARNEVRTAMRRSVLSLIAGGTPSSSESYEHLLTMIRHCSPSALPDQATEQALIRDTLRYAADELATSLGQFYGWSFQQEEQFLQDIANIVLPGQQIPTEQQIGAFHQSCRKLFLRQVLPYESCKHCHQPCLYRFFVKDLIAVENLDQWFREALERESQNPWADIGNTCLASLRGVIEAQPVQSLHGAAICYLLQKMHALNERALDIARAVEQVQLYFQDRLERLEEC